MLRAVAPARGEGGLTWTGSAPEANAILFERERRPSPIDTATCIGCSGHLECEAVCPKQISADWISWMARETRAGPS